MQLIQTKLPTAIDVIRLFTKLTRTSFGFPHTKKNNGVLTASKITPLRIQYSKMNNGQLDQ